MYQPLLPSADPVPPSTNKYRPILTQYHHVSTSTAFYWPSTIMYQPVPPFTDPIPSYINQYHSILTQYHQVSTSTNLFCCCLGITDFPHSLPWVLFLLVSVLLSIFWFELQEPNTRRAKHNHGWSEAFHYWVISIICPASSYGYFFLKQLTSGWRRPQRKSRFKRVHCDDARPGDNDYGADYDDDPPIHQCYFVFKWYKNIVIMLILNTSLRRLAPSMTLRSWKWLSGENNHFFHILYILYMSYCVSCIYYFMFRLFDRNNQ